MSYVLCFGVNSTSQMNSLMPDAYQLRLLYSGILSISVHVWTIFSGILAKGVFKGGFRGFKPPPEIFRFFLKSEGKEIERKRKKKGCWGGGGYLLTFLWSYFFEWG